MTAKTHKSKFRNLRIVFFSALLLFSFTILCLHYYDYYSTHISTDDAFIEGHAISLSSRVSGHISKVGAEDNQDVKEGDLLVELDGRDYQIQYNMSEASVEAAEAKAAQANEDVTRYKKLTVNDEISKQDLDHSLVQAKIANAELNHIKAVFDQTKLELSYTKIISPAAGRVTQKTAEPGAYVQVGQNLMTIVTPERWVVANLKETELTKIRPGQPVRITVDTYPDKIFRAHVESIQHGTGSKFSLLPPEDATGNFVKVVQRVPVKIVFDEAPGPDYPLALGMSVVPVIEIK